MAHYFPASYGFAFAWGLAVLFGMIGLGRLAALAIGGEAAVRVGWGLHAVWGMAVYLFLGATLAAFHVFDEVAISLLISIGLAAMLWTSLRGPWASWTWLRRPHWAWWPAFALALFSYAASVHWQFDGNWWDDGAYYTFCEKLLATGSFDEPFSWRRLASFGGQTLLESSTIANTSITGVMMFEIGLAPLIFLGLVLGFREGALVRTRLGPFLALLAVTTPVVRINSASHYTGVILFLGLFATLDALERSDRKRGWILAAGLVGAAFCSLRAQYVAATGMTLILYWAARWWRDRQTKRETLWETMWCAGALLVALLPWMLMNQRSNQTPLFPVFAGNGNATFFTDGEPTTLRQRGALMVTMFIHPWLWPIILCLFVWPWRREALAAGAVVAAALIAGLLVSAFAGAVPDDSTIPRYVQPMLIAMAFAALLTAAMSPGFRIPAVIAATIYLAATLERRIGEVRLRYEELVSDKAAGAVWGPSMIADYRRAQLLIPEGQRALVCADFPFLFDHARNDLWNIDLPHAASPLPGLPYGRPAEEAKRYLQQLGVEYVICRDFSASRGPYHPVTWQRRAQSTVRLLKIEAPYYLDFFRTMEELMAREVVLGRQGSFTVLQLRP